MSVTWRDVLQKKEQDKTSEKVVKGIEITDLHDKEFKVMVIKILTRLERRMDKLSKNFNK